MTRRLIALQIRARQAMNRDHGATAVEYGLMVALIAAVIVAVVGALGLQIKAAFNTVLVAVGGTAIP
jgi:pilus assembly protein Flp/PilA